MEGRVVLPGLLLVMGLSVASAKAETDCAAVVSATVAEIAVGAGDRWSPPVENLVRAAAGSACVKAVSGRYAAKTQPSGESSFDAGPHTTTIDGADVVAEDSSNAGDDASTGFTFKPLSGSPTRKPYERQRQTDDN